MMMLLASSLGNSLGNHLLDSLLGSDGNSGSMVLDNSDLSLGTNRSTGNQGTSDSLGLSASNRSSLVAVLGDSDSLRRINDHKSYLLALVAALFGNGLGSSSIGSGFGRDSSIDSLGNSLDVVAMRCAGSGRGSGSRDKCSGNRTASECVVSRGIDGDNFSLGGLSVLLVMMSKSLLVILGRGMLMLVRMVCRSFLRFIRVTSRSGLLMFIRMMSGCSLLVLIRMLSSSSLLVLVRVMSRSLLMLIRVML